jgi:hypothetical protein
MRIDASDASIWCHVGRNYNLFNINDLDYFHKIFYEIESSIYDMFFKEMVILLQTVKFC